MNHTQRASPSSCPAGPRLITSSRGFLLRGRAVLALLPWQKGRGLMTCGINTFLLSPYDPVGPGALASTARLVSVSLGVCSHADPRPKLPAPVLVPCRGPGSGAARGGGLCARCPAGGWACWSRWRGAVLGGHGRAAGCPCRGMGQHALVPGTRVRVTGEKQRTRREPSPPGTFFPGLPERPEKGDKPPCPYFLLHIGSKCQGQQKCLSMALQPRAFLVQPLLCHGPGAVSLSLFLWTLSGLVDVKSSKGSDLL